MAADPKDFQALIAAFPAITTFALPAGMVNMETK
jgi:hypothetical protein